MFGEINWLCWIHGDMPDHIFLINVEFDNTMSEVN